MKINTLTLLAVVGFFIAGLQQSAAQQKKISIQINAPSNQLSYVAGEIKKAAAERNYTVKLSSALNNQANEDVVVKMIADSASSLKIARDQNLKMPDKLGWQCYAIRVKNNGKQKTIYVLGGDKTGAMYGGLDIAEAIRIQTINTITNSDNKPYLDRRGIKFNIPLDLRTPSYT
ncbi:MAG: hypothetical protein H0X70_12790, partial [Segetibacter sp.]|nr:hypothetical protein [Segetibacter sp.]